MRSKIVRRGSELVVIIPPEERLKENAPVEVTPLPEDDLTLEQLLEGITPENRHPETDWGPDVGKERWEY
jgi:antitoxin component of MazEF toxin-antitoxin module